MTASQPSSRYSCSSSKDYDSLFSLGIAYQTARHDDAIAILKEALDVKPNSERAMMSLAMTYISKGDKESARAYLLPLKELDEDLAAILEKALGK